ncbi:MULTISPECIES: NAD-dependent epimerase/dehydratase family protein [Nocardia]|uniref:NAD-dependent epimerase n=1 Tax=Nocardia nova TaxID=37330 RepID=A0A2T2Z781_9NOCA|nr:MULTISPECIES: NAD-dependent epimerase/dehydratase family protein [Nocardia]PSR63615.1 NAD-dependent epimerase [Nocardia nova]
MRVVVVGATGNVGTAVVSALARRPEIDAIVGLARRLPRQPIDGVRWARADIRCDDLLTEFRGADVVVHLAWLFQPTHRPLETWRANVQGTERVLRAVAEAGVPSLVYASSVGAYSPAHHDDPVGEDWPTEGWPPAGYMREKAYVERLLDLFENEHPDRRVVRMRPAFTFQQASASQQRRLFAGPLVPGSVLRPPLIPVLPVPAGLRLQAVHADDIGSAYSLAIVDPSVHGPFNLAADPVIDRAKLGVLFDAPTVSVPPGAVRAALAVGWRLRLVPAPPELFDAMMRLPIMDTTRARRDLGWTPRIDAVSALREVLTGMSHGSGGATPPLASDAGGRLRVREFASGVGGTDPVDRWGADL